MLGTSPIGPAAVFQWTIVRARRSSSSSLTVRALAAKASRFAPLGLAAHVAVLPLERRQDNRVAQLARVQQVSPRAAGDHGRHADPDIHLDARSAWIWGASVAMRNSTPTMPLAGAGG